MALTDSDIELIKASWVPVRREPTDAGILLFRGLFTKFPQYLKFFAQFKDLDIDQMHENKRLIKHALKVIDAITYIVDLVGDPTKADELNEALVNVVRSHLKRKIGLTEFRNLGIVIIDFICATRQDDEHTVKLDVNLLVAAWTKLYGSILDLVKREEGEQ